MRISQGGGGTPAGRWCEVTGVPSDTAIHFSIGNPYAAPKILKPFPTSEPFVTPQQRSSTSPILGHLCYIRPMDKEPSPIPMSSPSSPIDEQPLPPFPEWLAPPISSAQLAHIRRENEAAFYPAVFDRALDGIAAGKPLSQVVEEYPVPIDYTRLLQWIHRDENRKARYYEAQIVGADTIADQMIAISDASDNLEDVQRSTLRINTRKWLLGVWNRKRYGDVKQIEQNVTIDMGEAMAAAQARVERARTIDVAGRMIE
jgi:hypothetical protein